MEDNNNTYAPKIKHDVGRINSEVLKSNTLNDGSVVGLRQSLSLVKKESDMPEPEAYQVTPCQEEETQFDISDSAGSGARSSLALIESEHGIQQI